MPDERPAGESIPIWIDTDPSNRPGGFEVDDGFALIQAFNSPELAIRGVTLVFGNAPLDVEAPIGREIVARFGPEGLDVHEGAATLDDLGVETPASRALTEALRAEPLRLLVLGPATNVATVLRQTPELASRMLEVVAVAGRRPGQSFRTGAPTNPAHCDCNFDKDVEAFRVLLDAEVPLTLVPWEISSKVWLRGAHLDRLAGGPPGARWLVPAARDWLARWRERFGVDGFNPFDTLAVGYLTSPERITSERLGIEIRTGPDDQAVPDADGGVPDKPYLVVADDIRSSHRVTYCHTASTDFDEYLMARLLTA